MPKIERALISVYDKSGVVGFAKGLAGLGVEIISSGGTATLLKENGVGVVVPINTSCTLGDWNYTILYNSKIHLLSF